MDGGSLSGAPNIEFGIATTAARTGFTERGLVNCTYHAGEIDPGVHEVAIS